MDTGVPRPVTHDFASGIPRIRLDFLAGHGSNRSAMRKRMGNLSFSTGSGLVAILLWSTTIALARSLSEQLGPLTAAASVYLCGGVLCLIRFFWAGTPLNRLLKLPRNYLLGCGFLFVLYTVLLYLAVGLAADREQAIEIGLVNYLWPASTILLSVPLLKKRASLFLWPGTVLALTGVFLVMTQSGSMSWESFFNHVKSNPAAYGLAFFAALSWALYSNLTRLWSGSGNDGAVELFIPVTGLVLLAMRLWSNEPTVWNAQAVVEAGLLGAITALAYALWDLAMRKGDLVLVATGSYFTPLLSTLVGCVYLKVAPSPKLWIGCALLVAGSLVTWRSVSEPAPSEAEDG